MKLPLIEDKTLRERLLDAKVTLVTDHITTGTELLDAVDAIEYNGGKVTNVIAYTLRTDMVNNEDFARRGISICSLHSLPDSLPEELQVRANEAMQTSISSR